MPKNVIYALSDPLTGEVRYIGKTFRLLKRFCEHLRDAKKTHKAHWIAALKKNGLKPVMEILEAFSECSDSDWQEAERFWISYFKFLGFPLLNVDNGGGGSGRLSKETRAKISASRKGLKLSDAARKSISIGKLGIKRPDISAALKGRKRPPRSPEWSAKISAAKKGKNLPAHVGEASVNKTKGKSLTKEQIESRIKASGLTFEQRSEQCRNAAIKRWTTYQ